MFMFFKKKEEGEKKVLWFKKASWAVLVLLLILVAFLAGLYISGSNKLAADMAKKEAVYLGELTGKYKTDTAGRLTKDVDFNLYWELWDTLKREYVDKGKVDEKKMFYGSLQGLASSLGDPYTVFMDPKDSKEFSDDLSGTFEGIGAEIGLRDDIATVVAPLAGMPAEKAGLKAGDKIMAINGESTVNMTVDKAVGKIRGPKGTKVVLTVYRKGFNQTKDIEIIRDVIYVKSVKWELNKDNVFVITISNFNEDTSGLFQEAAEEAARKNPKGVVLDLRNNPGGFLDSAVDIASQWLDSQANEVVVREKLSDGGQDEYKASGASRLKKFPTVVLINGGSASASEIVAGALQDYNRATIVGEKSFGKGSVQAIRGFADSSSVKITVAKWMTPLGKSISEKGIVPNQEVKITEDDYKNDKDPQMERALAILLGKYVAPATSTPAAVK